MSVDLYGLYTCSSCRAILLTAEAIGIEVNLINVDLENGEHQTPEYEEMNPQKLIPTLVDGDYKLGESRAILAYLADQYSQNERLYPKNPGSRALVDHRLYFDIGTLYKAIAAYYFPVAFKGEKEFDPTKYPKIEEVYEMLDKYLEGQDYVAGKNLTIADLSITATVTTSEAFGFDVSKYGNVSRWLEKMKTSAPGYRKANAEGLEMLKNNIRKNLMLLRWRMKLKMRTKMQMIIRMKTRLTMRMKAKMKMNLKMKKMRRKIKMKKIKMRRKIKMKMKLSKQMNNYDLHYNRIIL